MRVILGILVILIVAALGGVAWLYAGGYPVAATQRHTAFAAWVLDTAKRQSVRAQARGLAAPPLGDYRLMEAGARLFEERCALCHGAPGTERQDFASAMNPLPPRLSDVVGRWTSAELHWIIRHGLRMTGMPAWGAPQESEAEIWSVVAFINQLPTMDSKRYRAIVAAEPAIPAPAPAPAPVSPPEPAPAPKEDRPVEPQAPAEDGTVDGMVPPSEEEEDEPPPQPQQQTGSNPGARPMRLIPD